LLNYILRRLMIALPSLLGISVVLFTVLALAPGDPFEELATNPNVPPEVRMALRAQFGLDDPIWERYVRWLMSMLRGDWGFSFVSRVNVEDLILQRLPTTIIVIGLSQVLAIMVALPVGVLVTAFDTLVLLGLQRFGIRRLEALVISLVALVGACFAVEMLLLRPDVASVLGGLVPRMDSLRNSSQLYLAAGILGATVMPHNLYLHSSLVQTRRWSTGPKLRQRALRFANLDTVIALALAFLVNASILVLAAGTFHGLPGAQQL
jgi:hypothetical protein